MTPAFEDADLVVCRFFKWVTAEVFVESICENKEKTRCATKNTRPNKQMWARLRMQIGLSERLRRATAQAPQKSSHGGHLAVRCCGSKEIIPTSIRLDVLSLATWWMGRGHPVGCDPQHLGGQGTGDPHPRPRIGRPTTPFGRKKLENACKATCPG